MALKNIFQELEFLEIPFSVIQSGSKLRNTLQQISSEYHIITCTSFLKKIGKFNFTICPFYKKELIIERKLSEKEVILFKKYLEEKEMILVVSDATGKVYELKNNSFLSFFNKKTNYNYLSK